MAEITDDVPASHNFPEYSVSEISNALKRTVEQTYDNVRVKGEISGFKRHSSGHLYFALKDSEAVLDAVCWRGSAGRLSIRPEDGMEVVATGRLTTYPGRSKYQMVIERLELAGQGALLKLLEDRKRRLAAEGVFDQARKKALPFLPEVIGVVTSPTGAVIRDILHRLADRFPRHVLLWPVAVQGEGAAEQVAAAIAGFNRIQAGGPVPRPDLLIVARGGGSLEDLWAFNEEVVVRAVAASEIPLISAVGHETDTTLIDFVSDLRAPTPTGAAEMAVPVRRDLMLQTIELGRRLIFAVGRMVEERRTRLEGLSRGLPDLRRRIEDLMRILDDRAERLANALPNDLARRRASMMHISARLRHPREQIAQKRHALEQQSTRLEAAVRAVRAAEAARLERQDLALRQMASRLGAAWPRLIEARRGQIERSGALLDSFSYEQVLRRGFALVRDAAGEAVTAAEKAHPGDHWTITFQGQQSVPVVVDGEHEPAKSTPRKPSGKGADVRQGTLL
ncbi:exodeoxyribonuclease VII large subunit [Telmatospirillum siberiense]|uniref:Exodeoxyribonuclease 7 large subunit n=1 Tax=Telmatospirillum siberiense TaxID=382514 RepID=A0A2N3Q078_9PROT|nr:exodeoxyribonuclease VII large subunit [Telmatospirillum siberiense]PKU26055.1 exodeoxyribonuclease VII large subunit [Telmatospirillum siberiense]